MTTNANTRRLYNIAAAVLLGTAAASLLQTLWAAWRKPLAFDDAYMFARYATNMRHGLGVSWNLDGVHTYGQTSLLWGFVVLLLSHLHLGAWKMLTIGSWLCSIGAIVALAWAVARNARSETMSSTWRVLPWVALPLVGTAVFAGNEANGMETMLGVLLAALFVGLALGWQRGTVHPAWAGLIGVLLFLTRPDAAVAMLLMPLLFFVLMRSASTSLRGLATLLGVFLAGVALDLLLCKLYFHTALPLSFYMKSRHAYEGYRGIWYPEILMLAFFAACQLYLVALIFLARRPDARLIVCCVTPALVVFAYLETVTQIMGFNARYYAPYFAFFIVPALLVLDRWMIDGWLLDGENVWPRRSLLIRSSLAAALMLCFLALSSEGVIAAVRHAERRSHFEYDPVRFQIAATAPLPEVHWDDMMTDLTDLLVRPLPAGVTVAATEVGYLGAQAPQVDIIDLAGLNDSAIALRGFDIPALLARKPDIIWMPNLEYTYQSGLMLSDPTLLQQYDLYAGAANYGLAIRKDSPFHAQIEQHLHDFWSHAYPGYNLNDYLVRSATWSRQKHRVFSN
jgi:hypothetical protein